MLVSTSNEYPVKSEWEFPCLGKATFDSTVIILFYDSEDGVVVSSLSDDWQVGSPHEGLEMSEWVPFYGKVTIVCSQA